MIKQFIAKQYSRFIPEEKFIFISGLNDVYEAVSICKTLLHERLTVSSNVDFDENGFLKQVSVEEIILRINPKTDKVIFGLELSNKLFDSFLLKKIRPANWILLRDLGDHAEMDLSTVLNELPDSSVLFLNWGDVNAMSLVSKLKSNIVFYGFDQANCHVWASNVRVEDFHTVFELNFGVERVEVKTKLLGYKQINSLLAAAALAANLKFSLTTIKKGLEKVEQFKHRLEVLSGYNNSIVVDDSLDATLSSVEEALEVLNLVTARRRILVLGEMRNLGERSEKFHRQLARMIYSNKIDLVFLSGGEAGFVGEELLKMGFLEDRLSRNLQNPQLVSKILKTVLKGDVVLITGAHGLKFDEVVKKISKDK